MRYFSIEMDKSIKNKIDLKSLRSNMRVDFNDKQKENIKDITILKVTGNKYSVFTDIITYPVYMVSEKIKKVIESYDDEILFKTCVFSNPKEDIQEIYYLSFFEKIDCIDDRTIFRKNGEIEKLVINSNKVKDKSIFIVSNKKSNFLVINLMLAESILRRDLQGVLLKEVAFS